MTWGVVIFGRKVLEVAGTSPTILMGETGLVSRRPGLKKYEKLG